MVNLKEITVSSSDEMKYVQSWRKTLQQDWNMTPDEVAMYLPENCNPLRGLALNQVDLFCSLHHAMRSPLAVGIVVERNDLVNTLLRNSLIPHFEQNEENVQTIYSYVVELFRELMDTRPDAVLSMHMPPKIAYTIVDCKQKFQKMIASEKEISHGESLTEQILAFVGYDLQDFPDDRTQGYCLPDTHTSRLSK